MTSPAGILRRSLLAVGGLLLAMSTAFIASLALPVDSWRTGEPSSSPLELRPGAPSAGTPHRIWIDTDAACGRDARTDPDDCLATLVLAESAGVEVVGISTVFGNAPLTVTDSTTRALVTALEADSASSIPVFRGSAGPLEDVGEHPAEPPAVEALRLALREGPLTMVALGPLTTVALTLRDHPELRSRVTRLVAVMGRRFGHLFHPAEGRPARSFLGHGPVFRDFNFAQDPRAAAEVLSMGLPMTLIPYEAARQVTVGGETLEEMERKGGAQAWVARRSRPWLEYWREEINRNGFYPFDLVAATYVIDPSLLRCADVEVAVSDDAGLLGWLGRKGLFVVTEEEPANDPVATSRARYCPEAIPSLSRRLREQLTR